MMMTSYSLKRITCCFLEVLSNFPRKLTIKSSLLFILNSDILIFKILLFLKKEIEILGE